jgi:TolA-binding protein
LRAVLLRSLGPLLLLASTATAPFQCAKTNDPNLRMEEDPSQVLYDLADAFHKKNDEHARAETLRFLIAKYPSSRYAEMARQDLSEPAAR